MEEKKLNGRSSTLPSIKSGAHRENGIYSFTKLKFDMADVQHTYERVMGPLNLFAPISDSDNKKDDKLILQRPITPINNEVKKAPTAFSKMSQYIRRRLAARLNIEHVTADDQQELALVIMAEVNCIWPDLRMQADDPFLTSEENKEFQRRITVHVITVCETLFDHYLDKATILNKRGIFSGPANVCRLKTQLGYDVNKFLNLYIIRRYILADLKRADASREDSDEFYYDLPAAERPERTDSELHPLPNHARLVEARREKAPSNKIMLTLPEKAIHEMLCEMPELDLDALQDIIAELPSPRSVANLTAGLYQSRQESKEDLSLHSLPLRQGISDEELSRNKIIVKRSNSLAELNLGESVADKLDVVTDDRNVRSSLDFELASSRGGATTIVDDDVALSSRDDLQRLLVMKKDGPEEDDALAPLLQALIRSSKHDNKMELLNEQLRDLEERERLREERERLILQEAIHKQPSTVTKQFSDQVVVRTSDIRVSDRVCLSSITLRKYPTLYNDLTNDIDAASVKQLDSNLYVGEEISDVYQEMMKSMPKTHLELDVESLIEPTADSVNLTQALSSASLCRPADERIINPRLHCKTQPHAWDAQPTNSGTSKLPAINTGIGWYPTPIAMETGNDAKAYASWLQLWKDTINSDDYMKYLSTQESDYMGVVFHFYNSDDEDLDSLDGSRSEYRSKSQGSFHGQLSRRSKEPTKRRREREKEKEQEKLLNELRSQKTEYVEGMWNINSVLMGGLGKDPEIMQTEEVESKAAEKDKSFLKSGSEQTRSFVISKKSNASPTSSTSKISSTNIEGVAPAAVASSTVVETSSQDRLEHVWTRLQMTDGLKLDMAIKYSTDEYHRRLDDAIDVWERATDLIVKREMLLRQLEIFERFASDPNRFFERGVHGSSLSRLDESRTRTALDKQISVLDVKLKKILETIESRFNDIITYQGRRYLDKMVSDRTEMLYWLQEERKQQAFEHESKIKNLPRLPSALTRLQPIINLA